MRHWTWIGAAVLALALPGCGGEPDASEGPTPEEQRAEALRERTDELASAFDELVVALSDVTREELGILEISVEAERLADDADEDHKARALDQVRMIRLSLENAREREEDLRAQLAEIQAKLDDPALKRRIEALEKSEENLRLLIAQKEQLLDAMEKRFSEERAALLEDVERETSKRREVEGQLEEVSEQLTTIEDAQGRGFLVVGTKAELKNHVRDGLLIKSGEIYLAGPEATVERSLLEGRAFHEVDIFSRRLFVGSGVRWARVVSVHRKQEELWTLEIEDGRAFLNIEDPARFWRESHYLVVRVKR